MATLLQERPWSTRRLAFRFGRFHQRIWESGRLQMRPGEMFEVQLEKVITTTGWKPRRNGFEYTDNLDTWPSIQPVNQEGPDLYSIQSERKTVWMSGDHEEREHVDNWNQNNHLTRLGSSTWTGRTIFLKQEKKVIPVNEKFLQQQRLGSQGGHLIFFYDSRMETEEKAYPVSLISWKSYKLKRCTVNTLSAECQAMIQGVGALHWMRFLMAESTGERLRLETWETWSERSPTLRWRIASPCTTPSPNVVTRHRI